MRKTPPNDEHGIAADQDAVADRRQRRRSQPGSQSSAEPSIMFVCAANVCRSPLMAYSFAEAVGAASPETWNISSGGVNVKAPLPICELAAAVLLQHDVDGDVLASHRALRVVPDHLDRQDLIITASKDERAMIAIMRPALRGRTFTLNEAVALGSAALTTEEMRASSASLGSDVGLLARYAGILHLRRGTMVVPLPASPSRRRRRAEIDPQDIPDVHHLRRRPHLATLAEAWESTQKLYSQVAELLQTHTVH